MNSTVEKKVNFINSTQNKGLSPSRIALSFDGFGSISWHSLWVLSALSHLALSFNGFGSISWHSIWVLSALSHFFFGFSTFRPEHH
jgi:hypothetical protein